MIKPDFYITDTIVAFATIVKNSDCTIAMILTLHGIHMIVVIATVFMDDCYAWFTLDRNGIVKSCDSSKFQLTARRFLKIYDKNLLGCKSEAISVIFWV